MLPCRMRTLFGCGTEASSGMRQREHFAASGACASSTCLPDAVHALVAPPCSDAVRCMQVHATVHLSQGPRAPTDRQETLNEDATSPLWPPLYRTAPLRHRQSALSSNAIAALRCKSCLRQGRMH